MGMFSWCCKGCGHELKMKEHVRLNGCVGEYDGYGGAGGFSSDGDHSPSAWHVRCYEKSTVEQKLNDSSSPHADNQGFGPTTLEFQYGFDESAPLEDFIVCVTCHDDSDDQYKDYEFYLTEKGLEDQKDYQQLLEEFSEQYWDDNDWPEDWSDWLVDAKKSFEKEIKAIRIEAMGGDSPEARAKKFASLEDAVVEANTAVMRDLPVKTYSLSVVARQGELEGNVYHKTNVQRWEGKYPNRKWTGEYETTVEYHIGVGLKELEEAK